eukprot:7945476-Pyramimonas_sp.AAC.1
MSPRSFMPVKRGGGSHPGGSAKVSASSQQQQASPLVTLLGKWQSNCCCMPAETSLLKGLNDSEIIARQTGGCRGQIQGGAE